MINKKMILSVVVAATLSYTSLSGNTLEERIKILENIISDMKKENTQNEEFTEELDERISDVEIRSYTDKIQFGLGFKVESNHFSNVQKTPTKDNSYTSTENRVKLNLNMKSQISDDLKFSGRLSMYKNWGDDTPRNANADFSQGRIPNGSELYVERASVDWLTNKGSKIPFIISLGRLSTADGPSSNIKEGTKRKGTFSSLAYDWIMDGVILTANLDKYLSGTSIQFTYFTPVTQDAPNPSRNYFGHDGLKNTEITGLIINKTFKNLPFSNDLQAFYLPISNIGVTGTDGKSANIGDGAISGFMMEATKINGNLDLFAHFARSKRSSTNETIESKTIVDGKIKKIRVGLLTTGEAKKTTATGNAFWLGARYHINRDWKIGAEYNKGSKNWVGYTQGSSDPTNKLATRGTATEFYVTKFINKNTSFRLGHTTIKYNYTSNLMGAIYDIHSMAAKAMGSFKKSTNTYLTFNLLF